jgi:tRNA(Ile)-lysidine synthase
MNPLGRVRETIRRYSLLSPDTTVLAATSGGSDSVALAYLLSELDRAGACRLIGLAHFNHQLRAEADRDEALCVQLAQRLGRTVIVDRADVRQLAHRENRSIEDAARTARHAFLERARVELRADVIALGHTRDDQAETFLLRLLRGAGSRGLGAMHPRRGFLVRPLLDCRRADLQTYLHEHSIPFVHDETNDDVSVPRNRVRADLLPFLQEQFNPSIVDVMAEEAELARDEYQWLEATAHQQYAQIVSSEGLRRIISVPALVNLALALQRMIVRRAMAEVAHGRTIRFADVQRALDVALSDTGPFDGPRQRVERIGPSLVLTGRPQGAIGRPTDQTRRRTNLFHYPLSIPGEVRVPEAGCVVSAEVVDRLESAVLTAGHGVAVVQLDKSTGGFAVRNRRPGDRFRPFGLGRRKKLQDFFVDHKIVRERRDLVPIVVDDRDRIVWVAGHSISEDFRVTDPAQAVLILRLKGLGGSF